MLDVKHFDPAAVVRLFWRQGLAGTGMRDVVAATGVHRSSLYATFGGKRELYLAALDTYLDEHALPGLARLATERGLPAIRAFFARLTPIPLHRRHRTDQHHDQRSHLIVGTEGTDH